MYRRKLVRLKELIVTHIKSSGGLDYIQFKIIRTTYAELPADVLLNVPNLGHVRQWYRWYFLDPLPFRHYYSCLLTPYKVSPPCSRCRHFLASTPLLPFGGWTVPLNSWTTLNSYSYQKFIETQASHSSARNIFTFFCFRYVLIVPQTCSNEITITILGFHLLPVFGAPT